MSAPFKPTVKVSMHTQTAKDTARHNDRSMYKDGYELRNLNYHYDIMGSGNSHESELDWYEKTFRKSLDEQNERYEKQSKQQHMKTMKEYRLAHMPQELILQIGTHEDFESGRVDDSFCLGVIDKIVAEIERSGGVVLSWDLHNDETEDLKLVDDVTEAELKEYERDDVRGTPHLHIRFAMMSKGKINKKQALLDHEIHAPYSTMDECRQAHIEFEKSRTDISEKKKEKNIQSWNKKSDKQIEQFNNPWMTFTDNLRRVAESYGHEWCEERGLELDDENRSKRPHLEPKEFRKLKEIQDSKRLKEESKQLQETIAEQRAEEEKVKAEIEKKNSDLAHVETVYTNRKAKVEEALFDEMATQRNEAKAEADQIIESAKQEASEMKKREEEKNAALINENALIEKELEQKQSQIEAQESTSKQLDKDIKDKEEWLESRKYGIELADKEIDEKLEFTKSVDDVTDTWKRLKQFLIQSNLLKFKIVKDAVEKFDKFFKTAAEIQREKVNRLDDYSSSQPYEDSRSFGD